MSVVRRETDPQTIAAILVLIIADLVEFFAVDGPNAPQIEATIELILQEYYYMSIADLKYCFNQVKLGRYGPVYKKIDGGIILGWIARYAKDREAEAIRMQIDNDSRRGCAPDYILQRLR